MVRRRTGALTTAQRTSPRWSNTRRLVVTLSCLCLHGQERTSEKGARGEGGLAHRVPTTECNQNQRHEGAGVGGRQSHPL